MQDDISIVGEKEGVAKAVKSIKNDFEAVKKYVTVSVEVGKTQHKYIIGKGRITINEILRETGVSVEMPPSDSPSETITLRGPAEALGTALTMVYEKANSIVSRHVEAPAWIHKHVIGKQGSNIKRITQDYPKAHVEILDSQNQIFIEGPPEDVDPVAQQLTECVKTLLDSISYKDISVDPKYYKHIIGKAGTNSKCFRSHCFYLMSFAVSHHVSFLQSIVWRMKLESSYLYKTHNPTQTRLSST